MRIGFVRLALASLASLGSLTLGSSPAAADSTSGVDGALFRSSYDTGGLFALEGARLMPVHDVSFKLLTSYARSPLRFAMPGIGGAGDTGDDRILHYLVTLDMAFGMTVTERLSVGFDIAAYRTSTGRGYGARGRYSAAGMITRRSTGLIAMRPLSNIDQSADPGNEAAYLGDGLAGPLDARAGLKLSIIQRPQIALALVGSVFLPFGDDEMLLGDAGIVIEPKLAFEWRRNRISATRVVANLGARFRRRTVLESYDASQMTATARSDGRAVLDVGSELVAGIGAAAQLTPRLVAAAEAIVFSPLPESMSFSSCRLYNGLPCNTLTDDGYFADAGRGDLTLQATAGLTLRVSADVTANLMVGTGQLGARADELRITTGLVWAPQPGGMEATRNDRDGDGVPDSLDACPGEAEDKDGYQDDDGCPEADNDGDGIADVDDQCPNEPEDKDAFQDDDGCAERDNDSDGIPDATDRCPQEAEDKDGFEDEDGCPDDDNDGDGMADKTDKCPNEPETANGFEDDDGCPDVRGSTGPEERADRIDLKGGTLPFARAALSNNAKQLLNQVAALIKARRLSVRIEVHVALGTRSGNAGQIVAQRRRDKALSQQRAKAVNDYLVSQGVLPQQLQYVGIGSDRALGGTAATDSINDRVDFIKFQQGVTP